jgi:hypothetical protein
MELPHLESAAHATIAAALQTSTLINSPVSNPRAADHVASEILAALHTFGLGPGQQPDTSAITVDAERSPATAAPVSSSQDAADRAAGRLTAAERASGPENIIALLRARLQRELDQAIVFVERASGTLAELTSAHVSDPGYARSGMAAVINTARGSLSVARSRAVDPAPGHSQMCGEDQR